MSMFGQAIDEFFIAIGLKPDGVKKGAKEAEDAVKKSTKESTDAIKKGAKESEEAVKKSAEESKEALKKQTAEMKARMEMLAAGAKFWGSVFTSVSLAMGAALVQFVGDAKRLGEFSNEVGVSVERLDALSAGFEQSGGSAEEFESNMKNLAKQLEETATTGTSKLSEALEGVDTGELGRQRNAYNTILDIADAVQGMSEMELKSLSESTGLTPKFLEMLKDGRVGVKDLEHEMKALGVINGEDTKIAQEFTNSLNNLWRSFRGVANIILRMVIPPMNTVRQVVAKFFSYLQKHEKFVKAFFVGLALVISSIMIPAFLDLAAVVLANPITWFIGLVAALALVFEDLAVWAENGESALSDLWEAIFDNPEEAQKTWQNIKETVSDFFEKIKEMLPLAQELFTAFSENWLYGFGLIGATIKEIGGSFSGFIKKCREGWKKLEKSTLDVVELIQSAFGPLFGWLGEKFDWVISKIQALASAFTSAATNGLSITGDVQSMDTSQFADVPHEAEGGILTTPTHALVAEDGPEAIIPLGQKRRARAMEIFSKVSAILGTSATAADALPAGGSVVNNASTRNVETNIGEVNVYTQATDARGIASDIGGSMRDSMARFNTAQADYAY